MSEPGAGLAEQRAGHGSAATVMLHGLGGDRSQPLGLIDDELAARLDILAPDLRAHGATQLPMGPSDLTFATLARDVAGPLTARFPDQRLTLVGISMGAAVVCQLLAAHRLPVRRVVLIRPAWGWGPHPPNLKVYPRIADLLEERGPADGLREFRSGPDFAAVAAVSGAAARALDGQFTAPRAVARAERLRALPASAPAFPSVANLPVLVIGSDRDPVHPLDLAARISADLDGELRIVAPRYDDPSTHRTDVVAALTEFFART